MAGPPNPFSAIKRGDAAAGSRGRGQGQGQGHGRGRGRGGAPLPQTSHQDVNGSASRGDAKFRGRVRGHRGYRGNGIGGPSINRSFKTEMQQNKTPITSGDHTKMHKKGPHPGPGRERSGTPDVHMVDSSRDPRKRHQSKPAKEKAQTDVPMRDPGSYTDRFEQLKVDRAQERKQAIKDGQMADPDQPTSLTQAITPVGTCTSMCPEFERVERIVQKMVDKSEKYLNPETNELQYMETMMLKRFRRSAAGYDEQLPSDIRTPHTLLQSMNYLTRHVVGGPEPLALIHKFVWDRTRSIRNDFSVQQLTQATDVKIAVTCLERIARFHILSLHLLSSPANNEHFDHHQEREQLNNTMLSLMYYYDDNRGRIFFPNEDEFRAYYIIFSILDQRPDLEARVQRWPAELRQSPRVQVALELHAAASNTWEPQGTLDAKRPNAIAQGFYTRFFNLINSPAVSYLMGCVAEIYFNHVRQTAIQSIWRGYCRQPASQRQKNEEWTVSELTTVLCFDQEEQTIEFCQEQSLEFAENENGDVYLNWGSSPDDSDAFQPSSSHSFSENYVESKRRGRTLVAIILGLNIKEAAILDMIDTSLLEKRAQALEFGDYRNEESLFVSDDDNDSIYPYEAALKSGALPDSPASASSLQKTFEDLLEPSAGDATSMLVNKSTASHPASPVSTPSSVKANSPVAFNSQEFATFPPPGSDVRTEQSPISQEHTGPLASSEPSAASLSGDTAQIPESVPGTPFQNNLLPPYSAAPSNLQSNVGPGLTAGQSSSLLDRVKSPAVSWGTNTTPTSLSQTGDSSDISGISPQPRISPPTSSQINFSEPPAISSEAKPIFTFPSQASDSGSTKGIPQPPKTSQFSFFQPPQTSPNPFASSNAGETLKFSFTPPTANSCNTEFSKPAVGSQSDVIPTINEGDARTVIQQLSPHPTDEKQTQGLPQPRSPTVTENVIPSATPDTSTNPQSPDGQHSYNSEPALGHHSSATEINGQQPAWLSSLREAAEKRRTSSTGRKRGYNAEEQTIDTATKPPKVSKPELPPPPKRSLAQLSVKPLPTLPILEQVEKLVARKPSRELQNEPPKRSQVDEDEMLLSAARIAAESLRGGPRLSDSFSTYSEPHRSFSPQSSLNSSYSLSRSQSPQSSLQVNGYDVAFAPETDLGLGRSMSRTEQRIRATGGRGLAYKPLDFTPKKQRKTG